LLVSRADRTHPLAAILIDLLYARTEAIRLKKYYITRGQDPSAGSDILVNARTEAIRLQNIISHASFIRWQWTEFDMHNDTKNQEYLLLGIVGFASGWFVCLAERGKPKKRCQ